MTAQPDRFNMVLKPAGIAKLDQLAKLTGKAKAQLVRDLIDTAYLMLVEHHPHCVSGQMCLFPNSHPQLQLLHQQPPSQLPNSQPGPLGTSTPSSTNPQGQPQ